MSIPGDRLADAVKDMQAAFQATAASWTEAMRQMPISITRWARDLHSPLEVGDEAGTVLCGWCLGRVEWPCKYYTEQDERLRELTAGRDD